MTFEYEWDAPPLSQNPIIRNVTASTDVSNMSRSLSSRLAGPRPLDRDAPRRP